MAVTLTNDADIKTLYAAYNPIVFKLSISDLGTAPITKRIMYQVLDDAVEITKAEVTSPKSAGVAIHVNVSDDVQGYVFTLIPPPTHTNGGTTFEDVNIIKEFTFKWDEHTYNSDTDEETIIAGGTKTFKIINAALQPYELDFFDDGPTGKYFLGMPAPNMYAHLGHMEYVWCANAVSVEYQFNYSDFNQETFTRALNNIQAVPLCFDEEAWRAITAYATIGNRKWHSLHNIKTIIDFGLGALNKVVFERNLTCEQTTNKIFKTVEFLDLKGGRGAVSFEEVTDGSITTNGTEICRYHNTEITPTGSDYTTPSTVGGQTIIDKKAVENITLITEAAYDVRTKEYYKNFIASTEYHIYENVPTNTPGGGPNFGYKKVKKKFIILGGSVKVYSEGAKLNMSVTGFIANEINNQKHSR